MALESIFNIPISLTMSPQDYTLVWAHTFPRLKSSAARTASKAIVDGRDIKKWVPEKVCEYIEEKGLYGAS